ncbi:MAG TPA: hydrolase, partial [Rhodoblastus sp.]|nr:hydrolase [Rhodoblastus sp.]
LAAILLRFGLAAKPAAGLARLVKQADRAAAFFEATALAGFDLSEARTIFGQPDFRPRGLEALLAPISSQEAELRFLDRFRAIEGEC